METTAGAKEDLEADTVLVSVGRRPYLESLGLDKVGVALDSKKRIAVNHMFQTNVRRATFFFFSFSTLKKPHCFCFLFFLKKK